ncbi:nuclear transport factor 2 family protein [Rhodocytophaga aerolata]|uniref:Nuclear transport factor 2 family protein n=1 Tax=Rhodocytophaga aerolata TaxID=455078 RepID=A0ABT8RBB0_9BACT|nr:nuclear transport factor 2 family protein [Rhodocytophaga aerolata]MDO1449402.1 nuclear transport factor 2 family protein [Rhodocytophaga aerolata]
MSITNKDSNQQQIRKVIEDWAQAIREMNMEGILAAHPTDVLMFDVAPTLQAKGIAAYQKTWKLFFQYSKGGKGSFDFVDLQITAGNTVAFCHALLIIGGDQPQCRLTLGLKKVEGKWLIAHEHHSAPCQL